MITRRSFLLAAVAGLVGRPPATSADVWIREYSGELPEVANDLADMESQGAKCQYSDWRRRCHVGAIEFREGIAMVYGFATDGQLLILLQAIADGLEAQGLRCLCDGWARDRWAWTLFVRGNARDVLAVIGAHFPGNRDGRHQFVLHAEETT